MPWTPGDPWPDTPYPGGAIGWAGYTRLFVQAMIAPGRPWRLGPDPQDRLNSGNVMSQAGGMPLDTGAVGEAAASPSGLWIDITCDLTDLEITLGASSTQGLLTKASAGTLTASLYDPAGKYDPMNGEGLYSLGGSTRLIPGAPIRAFAEIINNPSNPANPGLVRYPLFTGTADRWSTNWTRWPGERKAQLVATDTTKQFVKMDQPEQPAQGDGDPTLARLTRIANFFGWSGSIQGFGSSTTTLQATTLAQSAWELVNRAVDDELGFGYFVPTDPAATWNPGLVCVLRSVWSSTPTPSINIGCQPAGTTTPHFYDIASDARPLGFDSQLRNAAYVSRSGGTMQTIRNAASIAKFGEQSLQRSDLGLRDDAQVVTWGQTIVNWGAFPHTALDTIDLQPALEPVAADSSTGPWSAFKPLLSAAKSLVVSSIRVIFDEAPDYTADVTARVCGVKHTIDPFDWIIEFQTVPAHVVPDTVNFTMGPDARDRLDSGFVLGG